MGGASIITFSPSHGKGHAAFYFFDKNRPNARVMGSSNPYAFKLVQLYLGDTVEVPCKVARTPLFSDIVKIDTPLYPFRYEVESSSVSCFYSWRVCT